MQPIIVDDRPEPLNKSFGLLSDLGVHLKSGHVVHVANSRQNLKVGVIQRLHILQDIGSLAFSSMHKFMTSLRR